MLDVGFNGPFWQLREWCGLENLCIFMIEKPDFVKEMIDFWANFVMDVLGPILDGVSLDYVLISEDMAYKEHSMISPEMVREFLFPAYTKWIRNLKRVAVQ